MVKLTITHKHYYVEIPAWFEKWALRLGFTVMTDTQDGFPHV